MNRKEKLEQEVKKQRSVSEELAFLRGVEWADENPAWISVKDGLPPFDWKVEGSWKSSLPILIYTPISGDVVIGTYQSDETGTYWYYDGAIHGTCEVCNDIEFTNVSHWMPLPNKPKASLMNVGDISIHQKPDHQTESKKAEVGKNNHKNKYGLLSPSLEEAEKAMRFIDSQLERRLKWLTEEEQCKLYRLLKALTNPIETRLFIDCEGLDELEEFRLEVSDTNKRIDTLKVFQHALSLSGCHRVARNIDLVVENVVY